MKLAASPEFRTLAEQGTPLIFCWEEFGWESPEHPAYLTSPTKYKSVAAAGRVEFVTLSEYLDRYGKQARETISLPMDAWNKSLTWGLGGDQVRVMDRKVEGLLLAAEVFDAAASAFGGTSQAEVLDGAWKDLMASQSHDVGLCEYSRWQGDRMAPAERIEDLHNFTWGAIGYQHLDAAQEQGQRALEAALAELSRRIDSGSEPAGEAAITVFNPHPWRRTDVVSSGRIYPIPEKTAAVVIRDGAGKAVPSQTVRSEADDEGNLLVAEVLFEASETPSSGYDTYYLDFVPQPSPLAATGLTIDEGSLTLENEYLRVRLDTATGGIASLVDKASDREMLDAGQGAFPRLTGRPNPNLSLKPNPPDSYDTATSTAAIDWLAKGPVRAEVRAQHALPYMKFETRVSLAARRACVEVYSRMLALVPPHSDAAPADIREGYWLSLAPAFPVQTLLRDYPFGVESTGKSTFHALTFVDLVGDDGGLLVLHPGTQFFRRDEKGGVSNLVMREWESHFTREYGWPIYSEYRHALVPHDGSFSNADRLRAAAAFTGPLLARVSPPQSGELPKTKSFVAASPGGVLVTAMRRNLDGRLELRAVEVEGVRTNAELALGFPCRQAAETDLLGRRLGDAELADEKLRFPLEPWKIRTFAIS